MFIGRTDVEAETPIIWPADAKNWLIGKDLMLGKIEGKRRRRRQRNQRSNYQHWSDHQKTREFQKNIFF